MERLDISNKLNRFRKSEINIPYEIRKSISDLTKLSFGMIQFQTKGWSKKSLEDCYLKCKSSDKPHIAYWSYRKNIIWH